MSNLENYLEQAPTPMIVDSFVKANQVLKTHKKILVSISGGKDSDVMLDLFTKLDTEGKCVYVWFDTGLEYEATKRHLDDLEKKYGVTIERERAIKPIPLSCKEYGQPFLSKYVSEMLERAQKHNFKFEDKPFDELMEEYPKSKSIIKWWCGIFTPITSSWNIQSVKWLKEFLIANPPTFKISNKCCNFAKKDVAKKYIKDHEIDCAATGVRKAEGGIRSLNYKSCFEESKKGYDSYRPLFWYKNDDEFQYINIFGVETSDCYTVWGLLRTGCAGCPYGRNNVAELQVIEKYEPKLYKAICNVFKDTYEYTRQYHEFCDEMKKKHGSYQGYLREIGMKK